MTLGIVLEECPGRVECWGKPVVNIRIPSQNGIREIWSPSSTDATIGQIYRKQITVSESRANYTLVL